MSADRPAPSGEKASHRHARVAVVQLAYHPAIADLLEDPLYDPKRERHSLVPVGGIIPPAIERLYKELRQRIRKAYFAQLARRLDIILAHCQEWKAQIVVFPEYSVPFELLEQVAKKTRELVIVAGTHLVDSEARRSKVYERLHADPMPAIRNAVCPVLFQGKALSIGAKIHPIKAEELPPISLKRGDQWNAIEVPGGIEGPMAVLICRDFLQRESDSYRKLIADKLASCRFLAVPSLTPSHTVNEFAARCWEEARRYGRPVLYANDVTGGGTSIFVDEGRQIDLQQYPERAGLLSRGEEGMIVADVDLGYDRSGESTRYEHVLPVKPFAAATFVYRTVDRDYAEWLDRLGPLLREHNGDEFEQTEAIREFVQANEPPLSNATDTRARRLRQLVQEADNLQGVDYVRKLTREVVFPADVLPLPLVRAAMARGAADVVQGFVDKRTQDPNLGNFVTIEAALAEGAEKEKRPVSSANADAFRIMSEVEREVRGGDREEPKRTPIVQFDRIHKTLATHWVSDLAAADDLFDQFEYEAAAQKYERVQKEAEALVANAEELPQKESNLHIVHLCRLKRAACSLNVGAHVQARELMRDIDERALIDEERLTFVDILRFAGELDRARALLKSNDWPKIEAKRIEKTRQLLEIESGRLPDPLLGSALVHVCAASLLLFQRNDAHAAFEHSLTALKLGGDDVILAAEATDIIVESLHRTIFENPPELNGIAIEKRGTAVELLEHLLDKLGTAKLPKVLRERLEEALQIFRLDSLDLDRTTIRKREQDPEDEARTAFVLARQGRVQEALEALPEHEHPWHQGLDRLMVFRFGNDFEGWRREALKQVERHPEKAPLEYEAAWALRTAGLFDEALPHAQNAFWGFPGVGQRCLLAEVLLELDRADEAWKLLASLRARSGPHVWKWKILPRVAERIDPGTAHEYWGKYAETVPEDLGARLHFATHLFAVNRIDEAAHVAWRVFDEHREQLSLDGIAQCARFQRALDTADPLRKSRLTTLMQWVRESFAGDPKAELLFLHLRDAIGIKEFSPDQRVDFALLEKAPGVHRFDGIEKVRELMQHQQMIADATGSWIRQGKVPLTTACPANNLPLAVFVQRILMRKRAQPGFFCAPVATTDVLPIEDLSGHSLLVSELELLLLEVLGVVESLREALGKTGRLLLFHHAFTRIVADAELFRADQRQAKNLWEASESEQDDLAEWKEAARLAISVHRWLAEGLDSWITILPDSFVEELPPLRQPENEELDQFVRQPLQEAIAYRQVLIENPSYWMLAGEAYSLTAMGEPEIVFSFAWANQDQHWNLASRLRAANDRILHLPHLVRLLRVDVFDKLRLLAELGFTDALGPDELIRLADPLRFGGFDKDEPKRLLDHQSWIAREPGHAAGDLARIRLAYVYASVVVRLIVGEGDPTKVAQGIPFTRYAHGKGNAEVLLAHTEQVGRASRTNALDLLLNAILLRAVELYRLVFRLEEFDEGDRYVELDRSPLDELWRFLHEWAGEDGSRFAAYSRSLRFAWAALDRARDAGPNPAHAAVLFRIRPQFRSGDAIRLLRPDVEASVILSACWNSCELPGFTLAGVRLANGESAAVNLTMEELVQYGAKLPGNDDKQLGANERFLYYRFPMAGAQGSLRIYAPIEAILLRMNDSIAEKVTTQIQYLQGPHDGVAHKLLGSLKSNVGDPAARRAVARHAATSLWRLVRDDPAFLAHWPNHIDALNGKPTLDDLRQLLSEPSGPFSADQPLAQIIHARVQENGVWKLLPYMWPLIRIATEIPSDLATATVKTLLESDDYAQNVEWALWQLDHPEEVPAGRLAVAILFLRLGAREKSVVTLSTGNVDLREKLPAHFEHLLRSLDTPKPDTFAEYEPILLRVCADVVQRLAWPAALPLRDGLWLTWRLFQWLSLQLDAIDPDARRDGMKRLAALAPQGDRAPRDRLDPFGFGRDKFDHRLAAVLHALHLALPLSAADADAPAEQRLQARRVSSKGIEVQLLQYADRFSDVPDLNSVLDWNAPSNVPDLALLALLHSRLTAFGELKPETRKRQFRRLPLDPNTLARRALVLPEAVIVAVSLTASTFEPDERRLLIERLREMKEGPISLRWRWIVWTGLFAAGEVDLEQETKELLLLHTQTDATIAYTGMFMLAVAAHAFDRFDTVADELVHGFVAAGGDVFAVVSALGQVVLHSEPPAKDLARKKLAKLKSFGDDARVQEVMSFLGVSDDAAD